MPYPVVALQLPVGEREQGQHCLSPLQCHEHRRDGEGKPRHCCDAQIGHAAACLLLDKASYVEERRRGRMRRIWQRGERRVD